MFRAFPKELFEHTLMVGGASNYLEYYSRGEMRLWLLSELQRMGR